MATQSTHRITWRCSVHSSSDACKATFTKVEVRNTYTRNSYDHGHPAQPGIKAKIKFNMKVFQVARENMFQSAARIVETIASNINRSVLSASHPVPNNLIRSCNYQRSKHHPADSKDLHFELDANWIPTGFVQQHIKLDGACHIVSATSAQITLLENARVGYCGYI